MTEQIRDGGPAFPMGYHPEGNSADQCGGLTIRDWYAGMALQGLILRYQTPSDLEQIGESAYVLADAMLKQREAK